MNILSRIFAATEAEVVTLISHIKTGLPLFEADLDKALTWVVAQAPTIASELQTATELASLVGVAGNPEFVAAVAAANEAVVALNAVAAAKAAGKSDPAAVIQGYVAVKQATSAVSAAGAAAATAN